MATNSRLQFITALAKTGQFVAPIWVTAPTINVLQVGAIITVNPGTVVSIPTAAISYSATVGGSSVSWPYTPIAGDEGKAVVITPVATNLGASVTGTTFGGTVPAAATFGQLGRIGGNIQQSIEYAQSNIFFNAAFSGRPFSDTSAGPIALDSNGYPAVGGWQWVPSASNSGTNTANQPNLRTGQLTLPTYTNCQFTTPTAAPCVLSCAAATITALTLISSVGGVNTYTFTFSPSANSNITMTGTQSIQSMYIPADGSTPFSGSNPEFTTQAITYYSQFSTIRTMDFTDTLDTTGGLSGSGKSGETMWSDPVYGRVPNGAFKARPYAWETTLSFAAAVSAASGGYTQFQIQLPGYVNANYATQLATLCNTLSVPQVRVGLANEAWNPAYNFQQGYQYRGRAECQIIGDYGGGTLVVGVSGSNTAAKVTSMVTDASSNITVTLNVPVANYPQIVAGNIFSLYPSSPNNTGSVWNTSNATIASVTTYSFTYPSSAPVSSSLTEITSIEMTFTEPNRITSIVSDGASPPNVTVTLNVPLSFYPFTITAGTTQMVASGYYATAWNSGTLASPVTVSAVTTNSFTYPSASAPPSSSLAPGAGFDFSCWIGAVANSGVGLDSALIKYSNDWNVFDLNIYYYTRQLKLMSDAWYAVRPNDQFVLELQTFGAANPGNGYTPPKHFAYGQTLGNASGTRPGLTWLYGAETAPYNALTGPAATPAAAFTSFAASLPAVGNKIDSFVYWSRFYGLVPIAYEWGPDISLSPANQIEISSDPGMTTMVKALGDRILQAGYQSTNYFMVSPGTFVDGSAAGGWTSQQTFVDTFTNQKTLALQQLQAETENYANLNGTAPCTFLVDNSKMSNLTGWNRPGVCLTFGSIVGGSGYTDGTYQAVALTGGPWNSAGSAAVLIGSVQAKAKIVVLGGTVISVDLTGTGDTGGTGYTVGMTLSALASVLGAGGSGFSVNVATTYSNSALGAGVAYFGSSGTRNMSWLCSSNGAGTFTLTATGTDSNVAGTVMDVYVDTVHQGTVTLAVGGAASSGTCTPAVSTTLPVLVPKGSSIIMVAFTGAATAPGFSQISLS